MGRLALPVAGQCCRLSNPHNGQAGQRLGGGRIARKPDLKRWRSRSRSAGSMTWPLVVPHLLSELDALDDKGFVVVPSLLPDEQVKLARVEFERLVAEDSRSSTRERGTRRAKANDDNETLAVCWRHRVVLDCAAHLLGPTFDVSLIDLRDPDPGCSHRSPPLSSEVPIPATENRVPGEIVALDPPGSLLVRDPRLFPGRRNTTSETRRSAFVFYQHDLPEPD